MQAGQFCSAFIFFVRGDLSWVSFLFLRKQGSLAFQTASWSLKPHGNLQKKSPRKAADHTTHVLRKKLGVKSLYQSSHFTPNAIGSAGKAPGDLLHRDGSQDLPSEVLNPSIKLDKTEMDFSLPHHREVTARLSRQLLQGRPVFPPHGRRHGGFTLLQAKRSAEVEDIDGMGRGVLSPC